MRNGVRLQKYDCRCVDTYVRMYKLTIFKNDREGLRDFDFSLCNVGVGESVRLDELS